MSSIFVYKLYSIVVNPFDIEKHLFIKSVAGIFPNTVAFINNTGSADKVIFNRNFLFPLGDVYFSTLLTQADKDNRVNMINNDTITFFMPTISPRSPSC